jgi:hypothetical protein
MVEGFAFYEKVKADREHCFCEVVGESRVLKQIRL